MNARFGVGVVKATTFKHDGHLSSGKARKDREGQGRDREGQERKKGQTPQQHTEIQTLSTINHQRCSSTYQRQKDVATNQHDFHRVVIKVVRDNGFVEVGDMDVFRLA